MCRSNNNMNSVNVITIGLWIFTIILMLNAASAIKLGKYSNKLVCENSDYSVYIITPPIKFGEGLYWSPENQRLYYTDSVDEKIYSYNPLTREISASPVGNGPVTFIIGVRNKPNHYIVGVGKNIVLINWNENSGRDATVLRTLVSVDPNVSDNRFNGAKVDSTGRLWGGTTSKRSKFASKSGGLLYSVDKNLALTKHLSSVGISSGSVWDRNNKIMYSTDSTARKIIAYDFNKQEGTIGNPRTVFDFSENDLNGIPEGMTIDINNNLWVADRGDGFVLNIDPRKGTLIRWIEIPSKWVTSVTFGGLLFDTLYVTTAASKEEKKMHGFSGSVFAVKGLGVFGLAPNKFKLESQ